MIKKERGAIFERRVYWRFNLEYLTIPIRLFWIDAILFIIGIARLDWAAMARNIKTFTCTYSMITCYGVQSEDNLSKHSNSSTPIWFMECQITRQISMRHSLFNMAAQKNKESPFQSERKENQKQNESVCHCQNQRAEFNPSSTMRRTASFIMMIHCLMWCILWSTITENRPKKIF